MNGITSDGISIMKDIWGCMEERTWFGKIMLIPIAIITAMLLLFVMACGAIWHGGGRLYKKAAFKKGTLENP